MHTTASLGIAGLGVEVDFVRIEHHVGCFQPDVTAQFSNRSVHLLSIGFDVGNVGRWRILSQDARLQLQRKISSAIYLR